MILDETDLTDRVTIVHRPDSAGDDAYGNPVLDWTAAARDDDVPASLQPMTSTEDVRSADRIVEQSLLILLGGVTIGPLDRVEFADDTYEVTGEPKRWLDEGVEDHLEVTLTRTEA